MPLRFALILVVAVAICAQPQQQPKFNQKSQEIPNLAGVWKLNRSKSDLRRWAKVTPDSVVIHQTEKTIRFDYVLGSRKTAVTYLPDGSSQHISMLDFHHEKLARAYWSKH